MLIPKVSLSSLDLRLLRRFLITGLTHIHVDDASLSAEAIEKAVLALTRSKTQPEGLQTFRNVVVGPVPAGALDTVTKLMNHGLQYILVSGSDEDVVAVLAELRPERLIVPSGFKLHSAQGLIPGGVWVEFQGSSLEELMDAGKKVRQQEPWVKHGMVIMSVSDAAVRAISSEKMNIAVGDLHHQRFPVVSAAPGGKPSSNADFPIHVQAFATLPDGPSGHICVAKALISCLTTDRPDGLYTTVVVDEHNSALGLVYSSKESITASLETGQGVYFSRGRKKLWRKGETSGAVQTLRSVRFDCDADALKFSVFQQGQPPAFCHRNSRSCWGAEMEGLGGLFRTLISRRDNMLDGSYTKRLYTEKGMLLKKMLEEVQELDEAVNEKDPIHVAEETADVLFFALTACSAGR